MLLRQTPNYLARVGAGRTPEFLEMMQVVRSRSSGPAQLTSEVIRQRFF